jgi:hypothetical protein
MEVHHHSQPSGFDSHQGKKKWNHYLWEFLMLFLAVFLGSQAENWREHVIEKKRAREYIESFYNDLKIDTTRLNAVIAFESDKINTLLQYRNCYDSLLRNEDPASLPNIVRYSLSNNPFRPVDRTLQQLSNGGGYRILKKRDADSINSYNSQCNNIEGYQFTLYQQAQDQLRNSFNEIVDLPVYSTLFSDVSKQPSPDLTGTKSPLFGSADKPAIKRYFNNLFHYLRAIVGHKIVLQKLLLHAKVLLEYFKSEYVLK